jgi:hypothetical protein
MMKEETGDEDVRQQAEESSITSLADSGNAGRRFLFWLVAESAFQLH